MQTLADIRGLLAAHGLSPNKALGQNFLIDQNLVRRLAEEAAGEGAACALEVGPGTGVLTGALLERFGRVVACELDRGLCGLLRDVFAEEIAGGRLVLIEGDCLEGKRALNPAVSAALGEGSFVLAANLPYGAATPLIATLTSSHERCAGMFVTVQKEVAERLRATPGTKAYGEISVLVGAYFEAERLATLPASCFWPRPKVTSEMVALRRRSDPLADDPAALSRAAHALFRQRRKKVSSLIGRGAAERAGIDPDARGEALPVEAFARLARTLEDDGG